MNGIAWVVAAILIAVGTPGIHSVANKTATPAANRPLASANIADVWPASSHPVQRLVEAGVPNFGMMNKQIWRSGQSTREGYQRLKAMGLKTVINLRSEFPQDKLRLPRGVRYVYIPVRDNHPPTKEQARQFLDIVASPANWPILVHCDAGEGRTGVMGALIRHSFDGWEHKQIVREIGAFRVSRLGLYRLPMARSQKAFILDWEKTTPASGYLSDDRQHTSLNPLGPVTGESH